MNNQFIKIMSLTNCPPIHSNPKTRTIKNLSGLLAVLALFLCASISYGQTETLIKRINCGGAQVTGADGLVYEADVSNSDVSYTANSSTLNLSYVAPLVEPYRSFRMMNRNTASEFNYTFNNLQNGEYKVVLHFAEPYHGVQNSNWNTRQFNIDINNISNGALPVSNFNIMSAAAAEIPSSNELDGARKVYKLTAEDINITGNSIVIKFTQVANDPIVNAIEVFKIENTPLQQGTPGGSSITANKVTLSWVRDDTIAIENYNIYAKEEGTSDYIFNNTSIGPYPNADAINLKSDTGYRFKIAAVGFGNPGNEGPLSDASAIYTTLPSTDPNPPTSTGNIAIVAEGTMTSNGSGPTYTIDHNLGYSPQNSRIQLQKIDDGINAVEATPNIANITSTTFDIIFEGNPTGDPIAWRIFGEGSGGGAWTTSGADVYYNTGNVGIGVSNPDAPLTVNGRIHSKEVKVDMLGALVPDYVFLKDYDLKTLEELELAIQELGHLPKIPSAEELEENGMELKAMNLSLLEKVEELTLYIIQQNKSQKQLEERIKALEAQK